MRTLERNKRTFFYCTYLGKTELKDEDGNLTGESAITYSEPVECHGNVTTASGDAEQEQFGIGITYDRVIQLPGTDWPIDEHTVLFVDSQPPEEFDPASVEYDYTVTRVAVSLNHTNIAISKVRS